MVAPVAGSGEVCVCARVANVLVGASGHLIAGVS